MKELSVLLVSLCLLTACEKRLSCDPKVDKWAKDNVDYYNFAGREELAELPMSRARAIYVGLSPERKVQLWQDKLQLVRDMNILTNEEFGEYSKLFHFLKPEHYETAAGRREFNNFADKWQKKMKEQYGWDDEKIFLLSHLWMTEQEFYESIMYDNILVKSSPIVTDKPVNCECLYSVYCRTSGTGSICATYPTCRIVSGCGIAGNSNCNGTCQ